MSQDARDLRDPQKLGEELLRLSLPPKRTMSMTYHLYKDSLEHPMFPIYPQDELLSTVTQREYREELQQAAKEGDKYASERLRELQAL
jgi:hypothetical protein